MMSVFAARHAKSEERTLPAGMVLEFDSNISEGLRQGCGWTRDNVDDDTLLPVCVLLDSPPTSYLKEASNYVSLELGGKPQAVKTKDLYLEEYQTDDVDIASELRPER